MTDNNSSKTDIVLFLGQSNMQGETEILSECKEVPGAYEYRYLTDSLVPLCNPVGEDIRPDMTAGYPSASKTDDSPDYTRNWLKAHIFGASDAGHTNMVPSFARAYTEATGRNFVAVHAAKGSTCIADWLPGTAAFSGIVTKAEAALEKVGKENIGHFFAVWYQGESDSLAQTTKEEYKKSLFLLKKALFEALPLEKFGIILVGHFAALANWLVIPHSIALSFDEAIRSAQREAVFEDDDFILVSELVNDLLYGDKKYRNPNVAGHLGALGQEALGRDAGANLARFATEKA